MFQKDLELFWNPIKNNVSQNGFFFYFWPVRVARQHAVRALSYTIAAALVEEWNIHTFWPGFLLRFRVPTSCHPLHLSNDDQSPARFSKINSLLGIFNCLETELKDLAASLSLPGKPLRPGLMPSLTGLKSLCVPVQRWLNSSGEKAFQSQGHMALTAGQKLSGLSCCEIIMSYYYGILTSLREAALNDFALPVFISS